MPPTAVHYAAPHGEEHDHVEPLPKMTIGGEAPSDWQCSTSNTGAEIPRMALPNDSAIASLPAVMPSSTLYYFVPGQYAVIAD